MRISYKKVSHPAKDHSRKTILINDQTYKERHKKVLKNMKDFGISTLVIYADKEHGSNFEYLTGFIPRFE